MTAPTLDSGNQGLTHAASTRGVQPATARTPASLESPILATYKRAPVEFVRGRGVHLYDAEGRSYLDFVG